MRSCPELANSAATGTSKHGNGMRRKHLYDAATTLLTRTTSFSPLKASPPAGQNLWVQEGARGRRSQPSMMRADFAVESSPHDAAPPSEVASPVPPLLGTETDCHLSCGSTSRRRPATTEVRTFIGIQPGMKDRLRTAIEALVDVLESLDRMSISKITAMTN
jgi:hypothetical protein